MNFFRRKSSRIKHKEISELQSFLDSLEMTISSHRTGARSLNREELYALGLQLFEFELSNDSDVKSRVLQLSQELKELTSASPKDTGKSKRRRVSPESSALWSFDANLLTNQNFVTLPSADEDPRECCSNSIIVADTDVFEEFENQCMRILSPDIFESCQVATGVRKIDREATQADTSVSHVESEADDVEVSLSRHRRIRERLERLDACFELEEFLETTQELSETIEALKSSALADISKYAGEKSSQPAQVQRSLIIPAFYTADQRRELEVECARETKVERDDDELLKLQYITLDCADDFTEDEEDIADVPDMKAIYRALDDDLYEDVFEDSYNRETVCLPNTLSKL